jgi:hypothetical protein
VLGVVSQDPDRNFNQVVRGVTHVVIDECHHLLAETYRSIFDTLRCSERVRYCVGMTATLRHRTDPQGVRLQNLFENIKYIDLPEMAAKQLGFFPAVEYLESLPTLGDVERTVSPPESHKKPGPIFKAFGGGVLGGGGEGGRSRGGESKTVTGALRFQLEQPTYAQHVACLAQHSSVSRCVGDT